MRRTPYHRTIRRVRWTLLERGLVAFSVLLMLGSAGFEAYGWVSPTPAPAAVRTQEEVTATTAPETAIPATEATSPTAEPATAAPSETPTALPNETPTETPTSEPMVIPPTATIIQPTVDYGMTATPTFTPLPTFVIGSTPLILDMTASGRTAKIGAQFSFFVAVRTASVETRTIEVRGSIDDQLEVVEAGSASGTCSVSNLVTCVLKASSAAPAEIIINVRVRSSATPSIVLTSQALARDDQRQTAASERVTVTVEGTASNVVSELPQASATARPTEKPAPEDEQSVELPAPTRAPIEEPALPNSTSEVLVVAEVPTNQTGDSASAAQAADGSPTVQTASESVSTQDQKVTPGLPPTLAPIEGESGAGPVNPSTASPTLPHTAASLPTFGFGVGLMGLALTLHGTRRLRRADARFSGESAKLGQLSPLVNDAADLQHATVDEIKRMQEHSDEMRKLLEP